MVTNSDFGTDLVSLVRQASSVYTLEEIEGGLTKLFLNSIGRETTNDFLLEILKADKRDGAFEFFNSQTSGISILSLLNVFEVLVDPERREPEGVVYTPDFIVRYIVHHTIDRPGKVVDISCGSGAFLLGAVERLKALTRMNIVEIIESSIYGIDISPISVRHTKIILSLYALQEGEDTERIDFNLVATDALQLKLKQIQDRTTLMRRFETKFDYVIGNPPYVRIQDLPDEQRKNLDTNWRTVSGGSFNLYFVFFEIGLMILKDGGKLGYIVPNNFFTSFAAINLRKFLHESSKVTRILNFNHIQVFQKASTYTCIVLLDNSHASNDFEYAYVDDESMMQALDRVEFNRVKFEWLDDKKWRVLGKVDYENIKKIENIGTPIGTLFDIRVGIATLDDEVFMVEDLGSDYCIKRLEDKEYKIERAITRELVKLPLIKIEDDLKQNKLRIIFPYRKITPKRYVLINEDKLKHQFPKCYDYLCTVKERLSLRDKGKRSFPSWYAYGRTQGFVSIGKRLYTKTFSRGPNFVMGDGDALFCNGYALFGERDINIVKKILNSRVMDYYVKKTSYEIEGNFQCYQKNFIERFSIPGLNVAERSHFINLTDKREIDEWLIKKYGLVSLE